MAGKPSSSTDNPILQKIAKLNIEIWDFLKKMFFLNPPAKENYTLHFSLMETISTLINNKTNKESQISISRIEIFSNQRTGLQTKIALTTSQSTTLTSATVLQRMPLTLATIRPWLLVTLTCATTTTKNKLDRCKKTTGSTKKSLISILKLEISVKKNPEAYDLNVVRWREQSHKPIRGPRLFWRTPKCRTLKRTIS